MYELILYLKVYVKSEKTFQRSFKHLNVEKLVHNVLTFYRFNNLGGLEQRQRDDQGDQHLKARY
jgi:TnpA family transposase